MTKEGRPRVDVGGQDRKGPVTDQSGGLPPELVPGAREASRAKPSLEEGMVSLDRTGTAAPEVFDRKQEKRLQKMSVRLQKIPSDMGAAAEQAAAMVPIAKAETLEQREMAELARQARELAEEADNVARKGTLEAIRTLADDDPDKAEGLVDFLARWPDAGKDVKALGLNDAQRGLLAVKLAAQDPEAFVRAMRSFDFGLDSEEKLAIVEELKRSSGKEFVEALGMMGLPDSSVREALAGLDEETRNSALERLGLPRLGDKLSEAEMSDLELQELKDAQLRAFDEAGRGLSEELVRAFPERARRELERNAIEAELQGGIVSARGFGETATAPMIVGIEGRSMPAIYKSEDKEKRLERDGLKKQKEEIKKLIAEAKKKGDKKKVRELQDQEPHHTRPGIEPGTTPAREWLAYQIDKALQLDVVPVTVMRAGPEGRGSVQDWRLRGSSEKPDEFANVDLDTVRGFLEMNWKEDRLPVPASVVEQMHAQIVAKDESLDREMLGRFRNMLMLREAHAGGPSREGVAKIAFFDVVTSNSDRHGGNFMAGAEGGQVAIDNGLIFGKPVSSIDAVRSYPLMSVEGDEVPREVMNGAERFMGSESVKAALRAAFGVALGKDADRAWDQFVASLGSLMEKGRFPTADDLRKTGSQWPDFDGKKRKFVTGSAPERLDMAA